MGSFSVDYMRIERSNRLICLPGGKSAVPVEKVKGLVKSLLDRMSEAKDIRLAEPDRSELIREWKGISDGSMSPLCSSNGELEDKFIPIKYRGQWGDYVDDPKAGDGRALKLFNTHFQWCVQLPMGRIGFVPGKKYRISARIRIEKVRDGEAFWAGIYSNDVKAERGGVAPRTANVPDDEYHWYVVANWTPSQDEYFWIAPPRFTEDGKSPVKGVYLDKVKFEEIPAANAIE